MSNLDSVAASYLESLNRHQMLFETMETYHPEVMQLLEACHSTLQAGGKVIWFGNGVQLMHNILLQSLLFAIN